MNKHSTEDRLNVLENKVKALEEEAKIRDQLLQEQSDKIKEQSDKIEDHENRIFTLEAIVKIAMAFIGGFIVTRPQEKAVEALKFRDHVRDIDKTLVEE